MSNQDRKTNGPTRPEVDETSENEAKERVQEVRPIGDVQRVSTLRTFLTTPLDNQVPAPILAGRTSPLPESKSNPDLREEDQGQELPTSQPDSQSEGSLGSTSSSMLGQDLKEANKLDGAPGNRTLRVIESRVNDAVERATNEAITNISAMATSMIEAYEKQLITIAERQFAVMTDMLLERMNNLRIPDSEPTPVNIQPRKSVEPPKSLQADKFHDKLAHFYSMMCVFLIRYSINSL